MSVWYVSETSFCDDPLMNPNAPSVLMSSVSRKSPMLTQALVLVFIAAVLSIVSGLSKFLTLYVCTIYMCIVQPFGRLRTCFARLYVKKPLRCGKMDMPVDQCG